MARKTRILVVEDEVLIAMRLEMALADLGYEVCQSVATGEDAIKRAAAEQPDVVLMDLLLAGKMGGIEAARAIHDRHGIPLIFLSGYDDEELISQTKQFDSPAYLIKPIEIDDLKSAIESTLSRVRKSSTE